MCIHPDLSLFHFGKAAAGRAIAAFLNTHSNLVARHVFKVWPLNLSFPTEYKYGLCSVLVTCGLGMTTFSARACCGRVYVFKLLLFVCVYQGWRLCGLAMERGAALARCISPTLCLLLLLNAAIRPR